MVNGGTLSSTAFKHIASSSRGTVHTLESVGRSNIGSTASLLYEPMNSPLKSSQQLNVDWSKFENHTFFTSAEVNVNVAFEKIINEYPFDGSRAKLESFLDGLTGFECWVLGQFPVHRGALGFSSTLTSSISVLDRAGALYPEISRNRSGDGVLSPPPNASMTIEMQLFLPSIANQNQIVVQKASSTTNGFSLHVSQSASTSSCALEFAVFSGSDSSTVRATLSKNAYTHVCATLNREEGVDFLQIFTNAELRAASQKSEKFGELAVGSPLTIGSGSSFTAGSTTFVPVETLSGSIDELRIWHSVRTTDQQRTYMRRTVLASDELVMHYRFNEPAPPLGASSPIDTNAIVLDSSGNSLHSVITNFTGTLRESIEDHPENPVIFEPQETSLVLFPAYASVEALHDQLLATASLYDEVNPNLITKLVPAHYLDEGIGSSGFDTIDESVSSQFTGSGIPGQGTLRGPQLIASFLYVWARMFDDLKISVDAFRNIEHVDYETNETVSDNFLQRLANQSGFYMPPLFNDAPIEQFVNSGENVPSIDRLQDPLRYVQSQLMRRALANLPDVVRSKGTLHSVKSFLRSVGIEPDNALRIRERGGPTMRSLSSARETKVETTYFANFFSASSFARSPHLSASRVEVGYPDPAGQMVQAILRPPHGISSSPSDGLLTSGSWTLEGIVKFPFSTIQSRNSITQSIARLCVSGSNSSSGGIVFNLIAISSSADPRILLYGRPGTTGSSPVLELELSMSNGVDVFDSERWNFSFGRRRNDDGLESIASSSYFLRVARAEDGDVVASRATSSFFREKSGSERDSQSELLATAGSPNSTGLFVALGEGQAISTGAGSAYTFLNDTTAVNDDARELSFNGLLGNVRFWSKHVTDEEWRAHLVSHRSTGVLDPLTNYNFTVAPSGSFGRLRMDTVGRQQDRSGTLGAITLLDFSLNDNHLTGTGFVTASNVLVGDTLSYSFLSPYFDEASTSDKTRVRGFQAIDLVQSTPWANLAPAHEVPKSEEPTDDVRFFVELSLVDALNRDIVNMFATFDALDDALGDPTLAFSPDYPDLERLRDVYFNRLQEKLNFKKFFEFFRWFNSSIGVFIEQLLPRKTLFDGTNYSVESHMLERHKMMYQGVEQYMGDSDKAIKNVLLLQLLSGDLKKY